MTVVFFRGAGQGLIISLAFFHVLDYDFWNCHFRLHGSLQQELQQQQELSESTLLTNPTTTTWKHSCQYVLSVLSSVLLMIVLYDLLVYIFHRTCTSLYFLYALLHKQHHENNSPRGVLDAIYGDVFESTIIAFVSWSNDDVVGLLVWNTVNPTAQLGIFIRHAPLFLVEE